MTEIQFPSSKVTDPANEDQRLHSVVRGRNDYAIADPQPIDTQVGAFLKCRKDVAAGVWPTSYFEDLGIDPAVPKPLQRFVSESDPESAARLVDHAMDHPHDLHNLFNSHYKSATLKSRQAERSPEQAGVDFLGWRKLDELISSNIYDALLEAFQVKYFFAVDRPEHYFKAGPLVAVYGCPPHPSYVAGHGAFAGATVQTWLDNVHLETFERDEIVSAGLHLAHYRTLAGVHWPMDNDAGFDLGRRVAS